MRTTFFFFAMLAGITASAQVTHVEPTSANYTDKTVSFRVWWDAGSRDATHLSKVWMWVDYITVNSDNTTSGNSWTRALVSGTPTTTAGTVARETGNDKGFWLTGNAATNYSATVTVRLDVTTSKFNWCAYVSDYPPNAFVSGSSYTLHGSPPFVVNGNPLAADVTQYGGNITALTDATGAPGIYCMLAGQAPGKYGCCVGLSINISSGLCAVPALCDPASTVNLGVASFTTGTEITITGSSYTQIWSRPVTATGCQKTAFNGGTVGSVKSDCRTNPNYAGDYFSWCAAIKYPDQLCPFPWRLPTPEDICRLHKAVTGANCVAATNANWYNQYVAAWAMQLAGYCEYNGDLGNQGIELMMLVNGYNGNYHSRFNVSTTGKVSFLLVDAPLVGRTLRCVRD